MQKVTDPSVLKTLEGPGQTPAGAGGLRKVVDPVTLSALEGRKEPPMGVAHSTVPPTGTTPLGQAMKYGGAGDLTPPAQGPMLTGRGYTPEGAMGQVPQPPANADYAAMGREIFNAAKSPDILRLLFPTYSSERAPVEDLSGKSYGQGVASGLENTGKSLVETPMLPVQYALDLYDKLIYGPLGSKVRSFAEGKTDFEKKQAADLKAAYNADLAAGRDTIRPAEKSYGDIIREILTGVKDFAKNVIEHPVKSAYEHPENPAFLMEMSRNAVKEVRARTDRTAVDKRYNEIRKSRPEIPADQALKMANAEFNWMPTHPPLDIKTTERGYDPVVAARRVLSDRENYSDAEIRAVQKTIDEAPAGKTPTGLLEVTVHPEGMPKKQIFVRPGEPVAIEHKMVPGKPPTRVWTIFDENGNVVMAGTGTRDSVMRTYNSAKAGQGASAGVDAPMKPAIDDVGQHLTENPVPDYMKPEGANIPPEEMAAAPRAPEAKATAQGPAPRTLDVEAQKLKAVESPVEQKLMEQLTPEEQIHQVARDRVVNRVEMAEGHLAKGEKDMAISRAKEAIENGKKLQNADGPLTDKIVGQAMDRAQVVLDKVKEQPSPRSAEPKTILSWVRSKGGIDTAREGLQGEVKMLSENQNTIGLLKKGKGFTLDELAGMARDEGVISEATPQALLDAIEKNQPLPGVEKAPGALERADQAAQEKASGLREGMAAQYPQEVIDASTLADGEKVTINGEIYTKGTAADGDILLKDGKTYKLPQDFATVQVDAKPSALEAQKPSEPKSRPQQGDLVGTPKDVLNYPQRAAETPETPLEKSMREAVGRKVAAEEAANQGDIFSRESVTSGKLPEVQKEAGQVPLPESGKFRHFWDSIRDAVNPLTSLGKEGKQAYLERRYRGLGWEHRSEDFAVSLWRKTRNLAPEIKQKMFWYLDGKVKLTDLPMEARKTAASIQHAITRVGKMLVERNLLDEATFNENRGQYIRYTYLKHMLGDKVNTGVRSNGKLDMTYLRDRKDLTLEQQRAIGLVEDVSVAAPLSLAKPLSDIGKHDFMDFISKNRDWVWEPSMVTVEGKRMGIGALEAEVETQRRLAQQAPNVPEIKQRLAMLEDALVKAQTLASKSSPKGYVQFPTSKEYGPLAGAYVKKPIAQDILPVMSGLKAGGSLSNAINKLMSASERGMAAFKAAHVALNPPTMFRNAFSNMIQLNLSGMPTHMIPVYMAKAARAMWKKEAIYTQAKRFGLYRTNWGQTEIADILGSLKTLEKKGYPDIMAGLGELASKYGKIDDFFKTAKFIEQVGKGKTYAQAAVEAHKWGMDYSLAHPLLKFSRRHLTPFITYQYKILPLLGEAAVKRPWVFAKYAAVPWLAEQYVRKMDNISDDDWKKLERDLPMYIKNEGSYALLPWKSPEGNYQWFNMQYFFPWGNTIELANDIKEFNNPLTGGPGDVISNLGLSNPYADIIYAAFKPARNGQPPRDPFTGREIYNRLDSPKDKLLKTVEWLYNKWAPGAFTRYGAAGYSYRAAKGEKDTYGRKVTVPQAVGRWLGVNIVAPTPEQAARYKAYLRSEIMSSYKGLLKEAGDDPKKKAEATKAFQEMLKEINK